VIYIGIDPGLSGGMALLRDSKCIETFKFEGATERDIEWALQEWVRLDDAYVFIEKVSSSPQMGVTSAFTFGRSYGFLRGLLAGRIVHDEVRPQDWQKAMGCRTKGDKNVSKAKAQQLFPDVKVTHAIADAMLIAEHCRRTVNQRNGI